MTAGRQVSPADRCGPCPSRTRSTRLKDAVALPQAPVSPPSRSEHAPHIHHPTSDPACRRAPACADHPRRNAGQPGPRHLPQQRTNPAPDGLVRQRREPDSHAADRARCHGRIPAIEGAEVRGCAAGDAPEDRRATAGTEAGNCRAGSAGVPGTGQGACRNTGQARRTGRDAPARQSVGPCCSRGCRLLLWHHRAGHRCDRRQRGIQPRCVDFAEADCLSELCPCQGKRRAGAGPCRRTRSCRCTPC